MVRIFNLTQHEPTPEQVAIGVNNLPPEEWRKVKKLLTFEDLSDPIDIAHRVWESATIVKSCGCRYVMIEMDAPFRDYLERACEDLDMVPLYSFPHRKEGVRKATVFQYERFVDVFVARARARYPHRVS